MKLLLWIFPAEITQRGESTWKRLRQSGLRLIYEEACQVFGISPTVDKEGDVENLDEDVLEPSTPTPIKTAHQRHRRFRALSTILTKQSLFIIFNKKAKILLVSSPQSLPRFFFWIRFYIMRLKRRSSML